MAITDGLLHGRTGNPSLFFLKKNTIGLIPNSGYMSKERYSHLALTWLKWISKEQNTEIKHARNGGEKKLDGILLTVSMRLVIQSMNLMVTYDMVALIASLRRLSKYQVEKLQ